MSTTLITLFLALTVGFAMVAAQREPYNITIGSTLSPTTSPSSWFSPSGLFAFGFYPPDNSSIGVWLVVPPTTTVWMVEMTLPRDALLNLTENGLELVNRNGLELLNRTRVLNASSVAFASLLDSGNFVTYGYDGSITFATFNSTRDTIMGGQKLPCDTEMFSGASDTNYSRGEFSLRLHCDGDLVLYRGSILFWSYVTDGAGYTSLNLDDNGKFYLQSRRRENKTLFSPAEGSPKSSIYYGKLDWDGIFRLNLLRLDTNETKVVMEIPDYADKCQNKDNKGTVCGFNSLCTLIHDEPICDCLPGFVNATSTGCQRNFTKPACQGINLDTFQPYSMDLLEHIKWVDDPYSVFSSSSMEDCKAACLKDCNCDAVLFRSDQKQNCFKQKLPLRGARTSVDSKTVVFLKKVLEAPSDIKKEENITAIVVSAALVALIYNAFIAIGVSIFVSQVWRYQRRLRKWNLALDKGIAPVCFSYHELSEATDGFSEELGSGGFGNVYKGLLPKGKRDIAVKKLNIVVGERGFRAEMGAIGKTHHRNLVQLLGFCHEDTNRLLVYEYMSNGSLVDFLFKAERRPSWKERMKIALDVAKGIHYLHDECDNRIIHCDIKPENILMDDKCVAKISDFGIAKLLPPSQTRLTITSSGGTRGYAAPEWNKKAPITVKADVYSYGIVLFEIICCRRDTEVDMDGDGAGLLLSEWVYNSYAAKELENLLRGEEVDMAELERLVMVGIWCVQSEPHSRPYMKNVVMMLEGYMEVPPPPRPSFVT